MIVTPATIGGTGIVFFLDTLAAPPLGGVGTVGTVTIIAGGVSTPAASVTGTGTMGAPTVITVGTGPPQSRSIRLRVGIGVSS